MGTFSPTYGGTYSSFIITTCCYYSPSNDSVRLACRMVENKPTSTTQNSVHVYVLCGKLMT